MLLCVTPIALATSGRDGVQLFARVPRTRQGWVALVWLGLLTAAIPFGTVAWAQQHIESGMAGILFGTMPVMAVVLPPLFLAEESFTRRRLIGALVGLTGIVLVMGPSVLGNVGDQALAVFIAFLGPLSHTLGAIYARRQPGLAPPAMATGRMIFGAIILTPLALAVEAPLGLTPGMGSIGAMLVAGVACTAFAMSLYFVVVRRIGAARSSLVNGQTLGSHPGVGQGVLASLAADRTPCASSRSCQSSGGALRRIAGGSARTGSRRGIGRH